MQASGAELPSPSSFHAAQGRFEDLDYFCEAYKLAFRVAIPKLRKEVEKLGYRSQV